MCMFSVEKKRFWEDLLAALQDLKGGKRKRKRDFSLEHMVVGGEIMVSIRTMSDLDKTQNKFFTVRIVRLGTSCPDRLWMVYPWPGRMGL